MYNYDYFINSTPHISGKTVCSHTNHNYYYYYNFLDGTPIRLLPSSLSSSRIIHQVTSHQIIDGS